jgi:diaminopimelate decarboxylase
MKETPHYIFKEKVLEKNYREFERLCERYLGKYVIAYSVKTNGFGALLNKLHELGSNFEVASMEEIMKTPVKEKVFNGCAKSDDELRMAIDGKFLINVDSKSEINRIIKLLEGIEFNVGLRVSLGDDKFGFGSGELYEVINYCVKNNIKVIGLSFHPGTQKNYRHYGDYIRQVERVVDGLRGKIDLRYLDVGGGIPDKVQLKSIGVTMEDYFKMISELKKFGASIVLEPGRCLVADAFDLVVGVSVVKEKNGESYAILDAGINVLSKITLASYGFEKMDSIGNVKQDQVSQSQSLNREGSSRSDSLGDNINTQKREYIMAGPLLFGNDVVGKYVGNLEEGNMIRVSNVGAYCYNLGWEISYSKPKVFVEN